MMDARFVYCLQNGLPLDMDVYDMAEWCCLAELGTLSMDNNCAAVTFPDFTRGHWNDVKGYKHAYAEPEAEKATEAAAQAFTAKHVQAVKDNNLWALYDALKAAKKEAAKATDAKAQKAAQKVVAKAQKAYDKAVAKAEKQMTECCGKCKK